MHTITATIQIKLNDKTVIIDEIQTELNCPETLVSIRLTQTINELTAPFVKIKNAQQETERYQKLQQAITNVLSTLHSSQE